MAKQAKKENTGASAPVISQKLVKVEFFSDTYYEGLPPFSPGVYELTADQFSLIEGKGTYKIIE